MHSGNYDHFYFTFNADFGKYDRIIMLFVNRILFAFLR